MHVFVLEGMNENARACARSRAAYYPYVEPEAGAGRGLLKALAEYAALVVTDDYPAFFVPCMLAAAARLPVRLEAIDSNGLSPMRHTDRVFTTAYSFRAHLQKKLPARLDELPEADPLDGLGVPATLRDLVPERITGRWPPCASVDLERPHETAARPPIDHGVIPARVTGGTRHARAALDRFLAEKLHAYAQLRNTPDHDVGSGLLTKLPSTAAIEAAIALVDDPEPNVRESAAGVLRTLPHPQALPPLRRALIAEKNHDVFFSLATAYVEAGGTDRVVLAEILGTHADPEFRATAAYWPGEMGGDETLEPLLTALDDEAQPVRLYAVQALQRSPSSARIERALNALREVETNPTILTNLERDS